MKQKNDKIKINQPIGQKRDFIFRKKDDHKVKKTVVLDHNDLCVMNHPTNKYWEHSLPKRALSKAPRARLNFTFRVFKPQQHQQTIESSDKFVFFD